MELHKAVVNESEFMFLVELDGLTVNGYKIIASNVFVENGKRFYYALLELIK